MQINVNPYPCCFWHRLSNTPMIRPFLPLAFGVSFAYWFKKCWGRKWKLMVCFFFLFCTFFFSICKICFEQSVLWKWIMMMNTVTIIKITHLIMKKEPSSWSVAKWSFCPYSLPLHLIQGNCHLGQTMRPQDSISSCVLDYLLGIVLPPLLDELL